MNDVLVPFDDLLVRVVITVIAGESVGVHETTERVTSLKTFITLSM